MADSTSRTMLQEKTIAMFQKVTDRGLTHFHGIEQAMIRQLIRRLYPRIEAKIYETPDEKLQTEIQFLKEVIDELLPTKRTQKGRKLKKKPKPKS